jgi:hypothetical protein
MSKLYEYIFIGLVFGFSFFFTVFIVLNTWEVFNNVDLPNINSIQKFQAGEVIDSIIKISSEENTLKYFDTNTASMGELDYMFFPEVSHRVFISKERYNNGWLQKINNIHYRILNYDKKGVEGDYFFYTSKSWRTISKPENIQIGDTIEIHNQNGKSFEFVIFEKKILNFQSIFVPEASGKRQLIIVVADNSNNVYYSFLAR